MTRIIVSDTGPLLHLSEAGAVDLLSQAGEVLIPAVVAVEFEANAQGWSPPQWARIIELEKPARQKADKWVRAEQVDRGEAEAIALALQEQADWLLTDDAQARQFAEANGLEVHGSIGVLLWSIVSGNVHARETAHQLLDNLAGSTLWISKQVLREAQKAIDALFE